MEVQTTHMYDICVDVRSHPKRPYALISKCGGGRGPKRGPVFEMDPYPAYIPLARWLLYGTPLHWVRDLSQVQGLDSRGSCQPPPMVQYGHKAGYFHEGLGM